MVGHFRLVLTEEKKAAMEEGGGTKESTKTMRKSIGSNFQQYVEERESWWCGDSGEAASWWTPPGGLGAPRRVEEIATLENAWLVGHYARDWLWEAQVRYCRNAVLQCSRTSCITKAVVLYYYCSVFL